MNIFVLDSDYQQAAEFYQDIHVKKICVEIVQILQNAYSLKELESAPKSQTGNIRKHSYRNHPVCIWARENINNFYWALFHGQALHKEFYYRFGKYHFSKCFIDWALENQPDLPDLPQTPHPQCFGDFGFLKSISPVVGYRKYYKIAKSEFTIHGKKVSASWTNRPRPAWLDNITIA
jgi:hypothetical protein